MCMYIKYIYIHTCINGGNAGFVVHCAGLRIWVVAFGA